MEEKETYKLKTDWIISQSTYRVSETKRKIMSDMIRELLDNSIQRLMVTIKEITVKDGMKRHIEGILLGSNMIDEILTKVEIVLKSLKEAGLTLNLNKREFLRMKVEFLGHQLAP